MRINNAIQIYTAPLQGGSIKKQREQNTRRCMIHLPRRIRLLDYAKAGWRQKFHNRNCRDFKMTDDYKWCQNQLLDLQNSARQLRKLTARVTLRGALDMINSRGQWRSSLVRTHSRQIARIRNWWRWWFINCVMFCISHSYQCRSTLLI